MLRLQRVLLLLVIMTGCTQEKAGLPGQATPSLAEPATGPTTLSLLATERHADFFIADVMYQRPADARSGARLAEIRLSMGPGLAYLSADPSTATQEAGKRLVVQEQDGVLRLVLFAADNLRELDSGPLARLRFQRTGAGPETLAFVDHQPIFAPPEANRGVTLGPPLRLEGD